MSPVCIYSSSRNNFPGKFLGDVFTGISVDFTIEIKCYCMLEYILVIDGCLIKLWIHFLLVNCREVTFSK